MFPPLYFKTVLNVGVANALNEAGKDTHGCVPLDWELDASWNSVVLTGAVATQHSLDEVPAILQAWQEFLDLDETEPVIPGTVQYMGAIGHISFAVWGIADMAVFEENSQDPQYAELVKAAVALMENVAAEGKGS